MIFKKCTEACKPFKSYQFCSVMGGLGQKEDNKYRQYEAIMITAFIMHQFK